MRPQSGKRPDYCRVASLSRFPPKRFTDWAPTRRTARPCDVGIESTIVAFRDDEPVLLRPGAISVADLAQVLGRPPRPPDAAAPRVSGSLALHYAPRTPASLQRPDALRAELAHLIDRD